MFPVTVISDQGGSSTVANATLTTTAATTSPTGEPGTTRPPNRFSHTAPKAGPAGTIHETVMLPSKGRLVTRERWQGKLIAQVTQTVASRRKLTITLTPDRATRRMLRRHRRARLMLSLAYTPAGGTTRTITVTARTPR